MKLEGNTVVVRPVERDDIEQIRRWRNDPEVARYHASREHISEAAQRDWYDRVATDPELLATVIETSDAERIGVAHFKDIARRHRKAEAGIYIGPPTFRGNLYGLEAFYLLLNFGFAQLNLRKVYGHHIVGNETARRYNDAFGFEQEGMFDNELYLDGRYRDYRRVAVFRPGFYSSRVAHFFDDRLDVPTPEKIDVNPE